MTLDTVAAAAKTQSEEHLRLLELCYRYIYLCGRRQAGLGLSLEERQELASLRELFEGDPDRRRRRQFRRFPLVLYATAKVSSGWCSGRVLNMSGKGMYLELDQDLVVGERIQVKVGCPGEVEYLFTCTVVHISPDGVGLSYCCVPLEMRRRAA